jgi:predicted nucleotidyltransferase
MIPTSKQEIIISCLRPHNPSKIGVFGSYARGDNRSDSDLDLLVAFKNKISYFDLVGMEMDLSEKLGIKVELVTEKSINPAIREYIENDLKIILNA